MTAATTPGPAPLGVAHIGAFSMPNWGDKLYPAVLEALLEHVGIDAELSHFCPVRGVTSAGEAIATLHDVRRSGAEVALVGGGDIVRFDARTVALDHLSVPTANRGSRFERARARWFAARHFLTGPGPWVPEAAWLPRGPAVLLSAGVHTVPNRPSAAAALRRYRAAWVRTQHGVDRLVGAGIPADRVILGPDMIFASPDLERRDEVADRGRAILAERLGTDEPAIVFQAAGFHGWPLERVSAALRALSGLPVATLSLGSYAGEDRLLTAAAEPLGIPTLHDLDADDITAVLAGAGAVFTTSMHAAIVGGSFGTPVLLPGVGKTKDAFAVCPEPPTLFATDDATLRADVDEVIGTRIAHSTAANRNAAIDAFRRTLDAAGIG